ncbi:MAG: hypothetical protein R3268_08190 [Acidiferrobacterales bacterium]|nr:hypothetical protein [Acidiferrobacterales bacterium]
MKRKHRPLWLALWVLGSATASLAHEGHVHPDDGLPLWQIVTVIVVAVAVYFVVNAVLKRRQQDSTTASPANDTDDHRD